MSQHASPRRGGNTGRGRLFLRPGCALYAGPHLETAAHSHHAVQISIALDGVLRLQTKSGGSWYQHRGVIIAADQPHRVLYEGSIIQLYLDPESRSARSFTRRMAPKTVAEVPGVALEPVRQSLRPCWDEGESGGGGCWERGFDAAIEELVPSDQATPPMDGRVARVLERLRDSPGRTIALARLAEQVGLSADRLAHLFREQTGLPVRRFILWLRLVEAVAGIARGEELTQAAHEAGFSDSAHLSRTFRRMFGVAPSSLRELRVRGSTSSTRAAGEREDP